MYVCICHAVTDRQLDDAIRDGARTEHDIALRCGAGSDCGSCVDRICDALRAANPDHLCELVAVAH